MADLFKKISDLKDEMRPNIKDLKSKEEPEPKPELVKEVPVLVKEEPLSSEEKSELDSDEREVIEGREVGELQRQPEVRATNWEEHNQRARARPQVVNNTIPDIESELNKAKVILQGAQNTNERLGGIVPWDLVLTKIETTDDKANLRYGVDSLISAGAMFGKDSMVCAFLWEQLKSEMSLSRGSQGFAAKLLQTQISQSFVDKNVQTHRRQSNEKGSLVNSLQSPNTPYG